MQDGKDKPIGERTNIKIPEFVKETGSDSTEDSVVSLGKKVDYYRMRLEVIDDMRRNTDYKLFVCRICT